MSLTSNNFNPPEIFNQLESGNQEDYENAKHKLTEAFSATKEPWLVNGLIDYFAQTNSYRIVEILIKVQPPHDLMIFNKLLRCLQEQPRQKTVALTLFAHIVRKHPTWLYKVVNHQFLKDLLKMLKVERDVITLISGLLCIISLLPIIPTSISAFLPDLFEIFNHVATQCHPETGLTECQITYLQYGLFMLFNRLYGMFPCNFMDFIRNEYAKREKKDPVYNHTIRNLLDTVKIHPNLITSTKSAELNPHHWKKMEPHDVVVECAKYSIDSEKNSSNFLDYPSPVKPLEYTSTTTTTTTTLMGDPSQVPRNYLASAKFVENRFESLWSPSLIIQATPPPTANMPNTPTPTPMPNFNIPLSSASTFQPMIIDSSPPQLVEAAIEATPETTPNKPELKNNTFRAYSSNSQTARNIWPKSSALPATSNNNAIRNSSMPSSPMKRDVSKNDYPPTTLDLASNRKLMRILSDRQEQTPESVLNISREDQEVNDINSFSENAKIVNTSSNNENENAQATTMEYEESSSSNGTDDENDVTPPLCDKSLYQRVDYIRRVKRLRMYSHCIYSAGTSPADSVNYMPRIPMSNRIKRYNSWPNLKTSDVIINSSKSEKKNDQQSSSVGSSSNEAVSAVSHFIDKKSQQNGNIFKKIREDLKAKPFEVVQKTTSSTQTIEYWPSAYESMFYTIFGEEMRRKQGHEEGMATTIQTTVTKTYENANLSPNEMIDKYIQTSLKRKNSNDYRDHIQLLSIQLQFEKHRREIHAERNRRLLGKSRQIKGLEQSNTTLMDQVQRLSAEIQSLNRTSAENRGHQQMAVRSLEERVNYFAKKYTEEVEKNKQLQRDKDLLQMQLDDELAHKKQALCKVDTLSAENFDLKNLYEDAKIEADRGRTYRDQLKKLESELIIFNEARLKCQQQMEELEAKRARDIEMEYIIQSYSQELQDMKHMLDVKTSQIDGFKARLGDYEMQIQKRDASITDQKRLIKSVKDVYEEKFKALEEKYSTQKSIMLKLEEHILELSKNQRIGTACSPTDERMDTATGYTSPLSISLSSDQDGLSSSLRSTSEIRPLTSTTSALNLDQSQQPAHPNLQRQSSIHDN